MVVIEHDMNLLTGLCDQFVALEQGGVIAAGPPAAVLADHRVITSYLGTNEDVIHRSGDQRASTGPVSYYPGEPDRDRRDHYAAEGWSRPEWAEPRPRSARPARPQPGREWPPPPPPPPSPDPQWGHPPPRRDWPSDDPWPSDEQDIWPPDWPDGEPPPSRW
jgi:hypothetical protein